MPYAVAATSWTNLLGCPTYKGAATLDAIRAFGKATWGRYGGEPVGFAFTGPTPAEPGRTQLDCGLLASSALAVRQGPLRPSSVR